MRMPFLLEGVHDNLYTVFVNLNLGARLEIDLQAGFSVLAIFISLYFNIFHYNKSLRLVSG